jgi:hypothetical protein
MTEKEETVRAYIAMCKCCLLAKAMKDCPTCVFNIGLAHRVEFSELILVPIPVKMAIFELME